MRTYREVPVEEEWLEEANVGLAHSNGKVERTSIDLKPKTLLVPGEGGGSDFYKAVGLVEELLNLFGYDVQNIPDMQDTPRRFVKALMEHCFVDPWEFTTFAAPFCPRSGMDGDLGIVLQKDIPFTSHCAHHMAAFTGVAHVAYIPHKRMAGLSKLARTVTTFAAGFCTQEIIGQQVADFLVNQLEPVGVAVILKASHSCMTDRGVRAHSAVTTTSTLRGAFYEDSRTRDELLQLLRV